MSHSVQLTIGWEILNNLSHIKSIEWKCILNGDITNCINGRIFYPHKFDIIKKEIFSVEPAGHSITISLLLLEFHENLISLKHLKYFSSHTLSCGPVISNHDIDYASFWRFVAYII